MGPGPGAPTIAPPDAGGGVPDQSGPGGPPGPASQLPPSGAPGASPVQAAGRVALGRAHMATALFSLHQAMQTFPPGEDLNHASKHYLALTKYFKMSGDQPGPGQGGPTGGMPGLPGPGAGPPGGGAPPGGLGPPPGPPPGGLPRGPAPGMPMGP
jgi:hypothetical protein